MPPLYHTRLRSVQVEARSSVLVVGTRVHRIQVLASRSLHGPKVRHRGGHIGLERHWLVLVHT